jgi:hypothetical protein
VVVTNTLTIRCLEYHVCFVCFMFVVCAFMEERECGWFVPFNLEHKCVSLFMLVFILHENSWEYDSCWCFGLRKDGELQIFKGGKI